MNVLIDSCIVIDFLRRKPTALAFIGDLGAVPALSVVSVAELRAGQRGVLETSLIDGLLANSRVLPVERDIAEQAGEFMQRFRKSHRLDIADALIAATAAHHGLDLATLNLKHFPMFPHLAAPY
jgi:predicted nucleic acid-binding protein